MRTITPSMRYLFLEPSVYRSRDVADLADELGRDNLILYDLNEFQKKAISLSSLRALFASSSLNKRYKGFETEFPRVVETYHMKTWDWREIYLAR